MSLHLAKTSCRHTSAHALVALQRSSCFCHAHLQQVDVCDTMLIKQLADSRDRADIVLGIGKEVVWHHALQLLFLLHMAGGIAGHVRVVAELQVALLVADSRRDNCDLNTDGRSGNELPGQRFF